ncbi:MAG: hypothetical protein HY599_06525 [Candidatus Omnitrophica bacterium]|nr:hypothetical protein [Candidatus Omnitrophota bacterium]
MITAVGAWLDQPIRVRELAVMVGVWTALLLISYSQAPHAAAVPWLVFAAGFGLMLLLGRWLKIAPALGRVLLAVYAVKATAAVVFFGVSWHRLSFLSSYQVGQGFWSFAADAITYHHYGLSMLESWRTGTPFNIPMTSVPFQVYCGLVYRVIGPHPLGLILLNSWYDVGTAWIAAGVAMRIGSSPRIGLLAAGLAGCWPSTLLWSSTLTKDPLFLFLEASAIGLVLRLAQQIGAGRLSRAWSAQRPFMGAVAGLCLSLFLATQLRGYAGQLLTIAGWIVMAGLMGAGLLRKDWLRVGHSMVAVLFTVLTFFAAGWVNPLALVSPRTPVQRSALESNAAADAALRVALTSHAFTRHSHDLRAATHSLEESVPMPKGMLQELERQGVLTDGAPTTGHPRTDHIINASCSSLIKQPLPNVVYGLVNGNCQVVEAYIASVIQPSPEEFFKLPTNPASFSWTNVKTRRTGFLTSGGTIVGVHLSLETLHDVFWHLPEIMAIPVFYPFPRDWPAFLHGGANAKWYLLEAMLLCVLSPLCVIGMAWCVWRRRWNGCFVCGILLMFLLPLGIVVANYGTLFRLRLQCLLPFSILTAVGFGALASVRWRLPALLRLAPSRWRA